VVDTETDEVYGHVVAADDFGEAQVIPLNETLQDMRLQLSAASVTIPTPEDIRNWQRHSIFEPRDILTLYVGPRASHYGRHSSPRLDAPAIEADKPPTTMITGGVDDTAHPRAREEDSEAPDVSIERPAASKHAREDDSDQSDAALSRQVRKKLKPNTAQPRFLACPYWKQNPDRHRQCCKLALKRIRDVKQHLHRRHTPKFYCQRCFVIFLNDQSLQDHIISLPCRREPQAQLHGISHSQHRELSRKSNPRFTEENQWFAIWHILFPGSERPVSAYIDSELSADLCLFREFWQNSGQDVLLGILRSNQWVSMSAEEQETQGRRILTEGLDKIYEDWLSSYSPATTESASSSSGIARTSITRSLSSETLVTSVTSIQLGPPIQASGAKMLEKDPNNVSDSAEEETALLGSGELENTGLTISNKMEVADLPGFPQSFQEINIDNFLVSG